jgi:hypothetical protein
MKGYKVYLSSPPPFHPHTLSLSLFPSHPWNIEDMTEITNIEDMTEITISAFQDFKIT